MEAITAAPILITDAGGRIHETKYDQVRSTSLRATVFEYVPLTFPLEVPSSTRHAPQLVVGGGIQLTG